ncbi:M23 family metallopeptidase [Psychroserpens sp.]|uniref:M23 family metallopeptidase n=1 Tax=Psychroserpens sp. TaxID=2020870 RepID=UPI003C76138E
MSSCSSKITKPSYIRFEVTTDSIKVNATNTKTSPFHVVAFKNAKVVSDTVVVLSNETKLLLSFSSETLDTTTILKDITFRASYGNPKMTSYDTLYNYQLPFPKNKTYQILQGNQTNFTHKGIFSTYALDFKMPVGDTVCAARSGYVAGVVKKFSKNGKDKSYRDYANYITLYHDDGTFSQYVHLKENGALVNVNDYVEKGQAIGLSGNTGWSTEPHLHFAVFKSLPMQFESIPILLNGKDSRTHKKWERVFHQKDSIK